MNEKTAQWARESISRHGFSENDIQVILQDDITIGSGEEGYWTTIIMNGSIPKIPYPLLDQLDDEEGRMLFFMQDTADQAQTCWLIKKNELIQEVKQETLETSTNTIRSLNKFRFTPIYGKYGWDSVEKLQLIRAVKERTTREIFAERVNRLDELLPYPFPVLSASLQMQRRRMINIKWLSDCSIY